ncbi:hypothetical protein VCR14J2_610106 [Vibrio coralliirubri]|nr:hypothetical protein VCR14J2_610106 [Vibrio coralliirubri]
MVVKVGVPIQNHGSLPPIIPNISSDNFDLVRACGYHTVLVNTLHVAGRSD